MEQSIEIIKSLCWLFFEAFPNMLGWPICILLLIFVIVGFKDGLDKSFKRGLAK